MANQISNVGFMSPDTDKQMEIQRRMAMAQALQGQAMEPLKTEMAGGWAVPISPWQGLAKIAQGASGSMEHQRAQALAKALGEEQQQRRGADISLLVDKLRGRPASPGGLTEDVAGNITRADPMAAQTPSQGLQQALPMMQDPGLQQMGLGVLMQQMKPEAGYTLGPGAIRFGPDGKPLAQAPFKPPEPDKDAGAWSDPYELNGAQVQKNSRTGEIRTAVSRVPAPAVTNVQTSVNAPPASKVFENENKLRDDYTTATKSFTGIRDAFNTVSAALSGPITAVSTLAAATKFMKMIDPESVVRESELNMALKATGMMDRFMNLHNTVLKGQVLTPTQAQEIQTIAKTLYDAAEKQQGMTDEYFKDLAKQYGLNPDRVVRKQGAVLRGGDRRGSPRDGGTVVVDY